jgi:RNA polymerase sigma factor (sigma-70 family)
MVASTAGEHALHRRLLTGDVTALAEAYDSFAAVVYSVALRVTGDRQAAEDVTQDTLLELWRRPHRYDPGRGPLRPWLATIAHNRSVDWIRREHAARGRDLRNDRVMSGHVPDIGDDVQASMTAQRVQRALSRLPETEGKAIRLAFFGGLSYRQVAEDLHIPEGTVKSRIRSGLNHLSHTLHAELLPAY